MSFVPFLGPRSSGNTRRLARTLSQSGLHRNHLLGPGRSVSQVLRGSTILGGCVSPLGSPSQAVTLLADVYHPGSQEDVVRIQAWSLP